MVCKLMSSFKDFDKVWKGKEKTIGEQLKSVFGREKPLRYRLAMAHYKINTMSRRLEVYLERLKARDKDLFERVVEALIGKDMTRASIYANEVAELRKVAKALLMVQVALEQISLRLETIREIGDVAVYLGPVVGVIKEVRGAIKTVLPEVGIELGEVQDMLQETMMEAGEMLGTGGGSVYTGPEARKIIEEAKVIAEQRMKESFPSLPAIPSGSIQPEQSKASAENP